MKLKSRVTFKNQIIIVVVALSVLPLVILGINSLHLAGNAQEESEKIKNALVISLSRETEDFFKNLNEDLSFTRILEKREMRGYSKVYPVLLNGLNADSNMVAISYISGRKIAYFIGEQIDNPPVDTRLIELLKMNDESGGISISGSFKYGDHRLFDLLYPLETGDMIMVTYDLAMIQEKLESNRIGKTGQFAVVRDGGSFFAGEEDLKHRIQFMEAGSLLGKQQSEVFSATKHGYILKGKRLESMLTPFWVLFTQKVAEANALTRKLKLSIAAILLLLVFASSAISFTLASNFSRPISNLLNAVKKNRGGSPETRALIDKRDKGELALLLSEFNRMIDSLKEAQEKLVEKERLAAVGEMANVIGHDIRNPLAAIKNGAYFLRYAVKSENPRIPATLGIIDREVESITKIVEDLLGYSRQRPPALSGVDVTEMLDEVISIVEVPEGVNLKKKYMEGLPEYRMDRSEMRQVLVNIINNAVQACNKPDSVVTVSAGSIENGDLVISVKDTGMGIPKEKRDKIFQAFYSTKEGGTGLGLASAKRIVERHQGTIKIESEKGKGTEVVISIPKEIVIDKGE